MSKHRPFTRLALTFGLTAITVMGVAPTADANVRNSTSAAACQFSSPYIRSGVPNDLSEPRFEANYDPIYGMWWAQYGLENSSSSVLCPIARNLPLSSAGLSDLEVRFRSYTSTGTPKQISCTAYSFRSDGSIIKSVERSVNINPSTTNPNVTPGAPGWFIDNFVTMDFGSALNASSSKGHYVLDCHMPYGMALTSIYSSEVDGVSGN